jgi:hypothetical protein
LELARRWRDSLAFTFLRNWSTFDVQIFSTASRALKVTRAHTICRDFKVLRKRVHTCHSCGAIQKFNSGSRPHFQTAKSSLYLEDHLTNPKSPVLQRLQCQAVNSLGLVGRECKQVEVGSNAYLVTAWRSSLIFVMRLTALQSTSAR